jgi:hypothetical protein
MTPITDKKKLLLEAIITEHEDFANMIEILSIRAGELTVDGVGLNGLTPFWRGIQLQLDFIREKILDEGAECVQKLGGKGKYPVIHQSVNQALAAEVRAAKESAA